MLANEIVILIPTRGRPGAIQEIQQAWVDTGAQAHLRFCVDDDDPEREAYIETFADGFQRGLPGTMHLAPRLRLAGTLNYYAGQDELGSIQRKAVGFMGDDHRPRTEGWDQRFAECLSGGAGVVYGNDLLMGAKMPTAVVMTADIPATLGYFCPPGMVHLCLDLVWKDWGDGMGRITYLDDVVIEHMHPANGKAQMDAGYHEVNSSEMVSADTTAYFEYCATALASDIEKLKKLP